MIINSANTLQVYDLENPTECKQNLSLSGHCQSSYIIDDRSFYVGDYSGSLHLLSISGGQIVLRMTFNMCSGISKIVKHEDSLYLAQFKGEIRRVDSEMNPTLLGTYSDIGKSPNDMYVISGTHFLVCANSGLYEIKDDKLSSHSTVSKERGDDEDSDSLGRSIFCINRVKEDSLYLVGSSSKVVLYDLE